MIKLEHARKMLKQYDIEQSMLFCGISMKEFDKEDLLRIIVKLMQDLERERKEHTHSMDFMASLHR